LDKIKKISNIKVGFIALDALLSSFHKITKAPLELVVLEALLYNSHLDEDSYWHEDATR